MELRQRVRVWTREPGFGLLVGVLCFHSVVSCAAFGEVALPLRADSASGTPAQQEWLKAQVPERQRIAERIGEEGARKWALQNQLEPLLDHNQFKYRRGPDQIYRSPNGDIVAVEAKAKRSALKSGYGFAQGTPEHAVESATRMLASSRTTSAEKQAALEILEAAKKGRLTTVVVRTSHVLGEAKPPIMEKSLPTSKHAVDLASDALRGLPRAAKTASIVSTGVESAASVADDSVDAAARQAKIIAVGVQESVPTARLAVSAVTKSLVVVGIGVEAVHRINESAAIEDLYLNGGITSAERLAGHAGNVGGFVGGWSGAIAGAQGGAAAGAAVGIFVGPPGSCIGGFLGGVTGGIAGYYGGSTFGQYVGTTTADAITD
jgi:hypothetical protein